MAAAALLRSVARKLVRAPPPRPLARGLRDGVRSGPGSLPPPTSDQGMGDRLVVGMAAAAGLRSGAGLPSLARKIARAPPQGYRRLLHEHGLHSSTFPNPGASGSTPPPISDKDVIENLRIRLQFARALAGHGGTRVDKSEVDQVFKAFPVLKEIADDVKDLQANIEASEASVKDGQASAA